MSAEAVSIFRELSKNPECNGAQLCNTSGPVITVDSVWAQRCLERNDYMKFTQSYTLDGVGLKCITKSKPSAAAESLWNVVSPSGAKSAFIRKLCPDKKKPLDERFYIEVWSNKGFCEKLYDVTSCEKHGEVYGPDGAFGSLSWNLTEDKLAYIAEKKPLKAKSYFEKPGKADDEKDDKDNVGKKFVYKEDWGESLVGKVQPVICVIDLTSGEVQVLEDEELVNKSCGQVVWCPNEDGIVFAVFSNLNVKLGIRHCPIRESALYHYSFKNKILRALTSVGKLSVRSPRFSPDGSRLAYMACEAGGPHSKCHQLCVIDWKTGESRVVIDIVYSLSSDADFLGLYIISLPSRCWHTDNTHIFLHTPCRSRQDIYSVNMHTRKVRRLTDTAGCWSVEDVQGGYILASYSTFDTTARLAIARVEDFIDNKEVTWFYLEDKNTITGMEWQVLTHTPLIPHPQYGGLIYESIVISPVDQKCRGLIVFPHGGPHVVMTLQYHLYFAFLVKVGFTVALVNYRGSTGFGEDSINSLLGHVGDFDIKDVQQCAEEVIEKYGLNRDKVVALGGSHGGFITAHLITQYPEFYKAAVMRNPVTNLVPLVSVSDIPDWAHVEVGYSSYVPCTVPTSDLYSLMHSMSPIANIDKAQAPTLILLGEGDRRVPISQGIEFHKALKARGVTTRLKVYPDNGHAIVQVEAESDSMIQVFNWFSTHIAD